MSRYARERDFDREIADAARDYRVPVPMLKAIIAAESAFNPRAYRFEKHLNDASYGLMQLLYKTARSLGYTGQPDGLYDPRTNIRLGAAYIADNLRTAAGNGHSMEAAISAYNAGFSAVRRGDGKRTTNAPGAPFINQAYVDRVLKLMQYFGGAGAAPQPLQTVTINAQRDMAPRAIPLPLVMAALVFAFALLRR